MNPEKLAKLQAQGRTGSKGTPRRVIKKVHRSVAQDDRKLQAALEKLAMSNLPYVEEVNMFQEEGQVLHFRAPKVHAAAPSNTYAIYGKGEVKELQELLPGILNQMGPDSLASLRRLAESYQAAQGAAGAEVDEDDEVPALVDSFEEASIEETA
ncbi:Nascent polypeptide-associated complex subunit beta [Gryganskiella cystojenkinii]|nr:Nascent polypeptide-associated complex subunit beta [Gryganskiella cystojenkinii]